jgi:glycine cleavage system H protein
MGRREMNTPQDLLYTDQHEWIRVEDGKGTVGITQHAQEALSDITFVELPEVGRELQQGEEIAAIESCKAAASIYAPAGGTISGVNTALDDDPGLVNRDPYGEGWVCKLDLSDPGELDKLMDPAAYDKFCGEQT